MILRRSFRFPNDRFGFKYENRYVSMRIDMIDWIVGLGEVGRGCVGAAPGYFLVIF